MFELDAQQVLHVRPFLSVTTGIVVLFVGKPLLALLAITVAFMLAQNLVGVGAARLLGLDPSVGLLAGSISMTGGHGTAIAWAPVIADERGVANAMEIGVVCATMGLVLASLAGGPIARYLIQRHRLEAPRHKGFDVGVLLEAERPQIDYFSFLRAILAIHVAAIVGLLLSGWLEGAGIKVPLFLPCLAAGIVLTNLLPRFLPSGAWPSHTAALALIAEVSLGVRRAARSAARAAARASCALRRVRLLSGSGTRLRRGSRGGRIHRFRTRCDADRFGQHDRRNPGPRTLAPRVPDRAARRRFFHRRRECVRDSHDERRT